MASSVILKDIIVVDYSVSTTTNSSVSPFGAYADFDASNATPTPPQGYRAISAIPNGTGSTNPVLCRIYKSDGSCFVYSKSALTIGLRIVYQKV